MASRYQLKFWQPSTKGGPLDRVYFSTPWQRFFILEHFLSPPPPKGLAKGLSITHLYIRQLIQMCGSVKLYYIFEILLTYDPSCWRMKVSSSASLIVTRSWPLSRQTPLASLHVFHSLLGKSSNIQYKEFSRLNTVWPKDNTQDEKSRNTLQLKTKLIVQRTDP